MRVGFSQQTMLPVLVMAAASRFIAGGGTGAARVEELWWDNMTGIGRRGRRATR